MYAVRLHAGREAQKAAYPDHADAPKSALPCRKTGRRAHDSSTCSRYWANWAYVNLPWANITSPVFPLQQIILIDQGGIIPVFQNVFHDFRFIIGVTLRKEGPVQGGAFDAKGNILQDFLLGAQIFHCQLHALLILEPARFVDLVYGTAAGPACRSIRTRTAPRPYQEPKYRKRMLDSFRFAIDVSLSKARATRDAMRADCPYKAVFFLTSPLDMRRMPLDNTPNTCQSQAP